MSLSRAIAALAAGFAHGTAVSPKSYHELQQEIADRAADARQQGTREDIANELAEAALVRITGPDGPDVDAIWALHGTTFHISVPESRTGRPRVLVNGSAVGYCTEVEEAEEPPNLGSVAGILLAIDDDVELRRTLSRLAAGEDILDALP